MEQVVPKTFASVPLTQGADCSAKQERLKKLTTKRKALLQVNFIDPPGSTA
jgi:hypothetical protein